MSDRDAAPTPEVRAEAESLAVKLVHGGFTDFEDAVEAVFEALDDVGSRAGRLALADEVVSAVWSARLAEQEGWPPVTGPDRLTAAFGALSGRGIVTEPNFACCASCGLAEIGGQALPGSRGFVFFHEQDTARAVAGQGLMLAYGGFSGAAPETAQVGREVAAALVAAGLPVEWNGSPDSRIRVTPLEWRRRLPAARATAADPES